MQALLAHFTNVLADPRDAYIFMTYALGLLITALVFWVHGWATKETCDANAKLRAAIAAAKPVRGRISRFGTTGADEYSVTYTFTLEGDVTVYHTISDYLSSASHGALTKPGDVVTFNVLPGYRYVRDFYNPAVSDRA